MIFIARNRDGLPVGIVSAKTQESAMAYWQGTGCDYDSIRPFDVNEDRDNERLGYVTPILKTIVIDYNFTATKPGKVLTIIK